MSRKRRTRNAESEEWWSTSTGLVTHPRNAELAKAEAAMNRRLERRVHTRGRVTKRAIA